MSLSHPAVLYVERIVRTYKNIGIQLSGGMDSTFMSYLLHDARARLKTDNVFEYITTPKADGSLFHANNVRAYLDRLFSEGRQTIMHVAGDPTLHHAQQAASGLRYALNELPHLEVVLNGANVTPKDLPGGPIRYRSMNPRVLMPFFYYTKDVMVKLQIDLGLTELMKLSHTCTEQTMLRCNECWQCRERAWAFKVNNFTDPGER